MIDLVSGSAITSLRPASSVSAAAGTVSSATKRNTRRTSPISTMSPSRNPAARETDSPLTSSSGFSAISVIDADERVTRKIECSAGTSWSPNRRSQSVPCPMRNEPSETGRIGNRASLAAIRRNATASRGRNLMIFSTAILAVSTKSHP